VKQFKKNSKLAVYCTSLLKVNSTLRLLATP